MVRERDRAGERGAFPHAMEAYRWACRMDVAVRKPGNVSLASAGHAMQAAQFLASAEASCGPLFHKDMRIGKRIEAAIVATRAVAGCNTNLGIVLLCAPLIRAAEVASGDTPASLEAALHAVLADLDVADSAAAYRAIAIANPGGLGWVEAQDVAIAPSVDLRAAMALAADRDLIARQYANGFDDLFRFGLQSFRRFDTASVALRVQQTFLSWLACFPDSHIVRKQGLAAARAVSSEAQAWRMRLAAEPSASEPAGFVGWDESLKASGLNPGTSADLTVCTLFLAALLDPKLPTSCESSCTSDLAPCSRSQASATDEQSGPTGSRQG